MAEAPSRILALVFTDLANSTALRTEHGDQAGDAVISRHREHVTRLAEEHGGRIIDWAGDGCFLTFDTASAGVTFALRLQQAHGQEPDLLPVRVGIHLGEVTEQDGPNDTIHVKGLAVDLAARIGSLAQPGQVLMSNAVYDGARQRMNADAFDQPVRWQTHGAYTLKGFDKPIHIGEAGFQGLSPLAAPPASEKARPQSRRSYRLPLVGLAAVVVVLLVLAYGASVQNPVPEEAPSLRDIPQSSTNLTNIPQFDGRPAIAVLPFDNLSPDPDQAFLADGLSEDLITRLASWRAFPVIARSSSFQYRGGDLDLKQVGAELGARYLVEGSVRRAGGRIRITAQLIDAVTAEQIWAERYDRAIADVFTLQDEIGSTIAASLVDDLTLAEGKRARQKGTENLEAWSLYQLGLRHADRYTPADSVEAARLFERAVELDPGFATALAHLAHENWMIAAGDGQTPTDEQLDSALATARRAVELDPRDPFAHAALSAVYIAAGDAQNAVEAARRAVTLNPSMPMAWIWFGWSQLLAGDPEACIVATERAQTLNPQRQMVWVYDSLALAYWETGRYADALDMGRRLIALQPTYFPGYLYIAMSFVSLGDIEQAQAIIAEGRRVRPDLSISLMQNYLAVSRPEFDARRNAALRTAGLE